MAIVRWDPFRDFGFASPSSTWMPPVDIFQNGDHELVLKAELPDMTREDIDINIENFVLTIKGEKKSDRGEGRAVPSHRAALRRVQPVVLAAADRRHQPRVGRVQERRAHRPAAASRRSQAAADQGGRGGLRGRAGGEVGRAGRVTCRDLPGPPVHVLTSIPDMDEPTRSNRLPTRPKCRPSRCPQSRAGFFSSTSPRSGPSSCAAAPSPVSATKSVPHKAERVAMEEVKRGLVYYDVPAAETRPTRLKL